MTDPLGAISTRSTPQSAPATPTQVKNNAGGFVFTVDELAQLRRFLTLGVAGGTYYVGAKDLAVENAQLVIKLATTRPTELLAEIITISEGGRAPKVQPTLFALAIAGSHGTDDDRRAALAVLPRIARTGTHLLTFIKYVEQFRGWGPTLAKAVARWYTSPPVDSVAYQMVKYRERERWAHRDALRVAHPKTTEPARRALFNWVCTGAVTSSTGPNDVERTVGATSADLPRIVEGFQRAKNETDAKRVAALVREYNLTWEMLPTQLLNTVPVWEALLEVGVPQTALMRQLARLTNLGLLPNAGKGMTNEVVHQLTNAERLQRGRVHPMNVLVALRTYAQGHGMRGSLTWTPSRRIVDALDAAFYAAYGAVVPTGKRTLLALDVSGSMSMASISDLPITPREASAALALVTANVESEYEVIGFTGTGFSATAPRSARQWGRDSAVSPLSISPRQRLDDVIRTISGLQFSSTDCALPMRYAQANNLEFDTFVVYTDNETWSGAIHPFQALRQYREATDIPARLVVVGMTATPFTIADPSDAGMLDIAGFDTSVPNLISDFTRGDV